MVEKIKLKLSLSSNKEKAKILSGFFKTGKGQYGEGDIFIGVTVPAARTIAKEFKNADLGTISELIQSPIHEERLCALLILVEQFKKAEDSEKEEIVNFYLSKTKHINNWDLVDLSAPYILGIYLIDKKKDILYTLAESANLWERRISIVSTLMFIRKGVLDESISLAEKLLYDKHDLMQKANGWVLREVGKKDESLLHTFLEKFHTTMPRTTLRYAIERLDKEKKNYYMKRKV